MRSIIAFAVQLLAGAFLLAAAPYGHAHIYRWVDDSGNVTYSNSPPMDPSKVRELVTIQEDRPPTAAERRTREILEDAERERRAIGGTVSSMPMQTGTFESAGRDTQTDLSHADAEGMRRENDWGVRPWRARPEAVRDPCLRSSDPLCYQRNAAKYHPYLGYSPSRMDPAAGPFGATWASAGGTVGGTFGAPAVSPTKATPRRLTGLPPGTPVQPLAAKKQR